MSPQQQQQLLAFTTNYCRQIRELATEQEAEVLLLLASATLLATVFELPIENTDDSIDTFIVIAIKMALQQFYGEVQA